MKLHQAQLVSEHFYFLEAPKWRDGMIWTSDPHDTKVLRVTPEGVSTKLCDVKNNPAGLGFMSDGRLIIASQFDRSLYQWKDGELGVYADLSRIAPGPLNDFVIDAQDRIYVGNFGYDYYNGEAPRPTCMHRVDPDGKVTEVAWDLEFPNAAVIIHGGKTLVVNETWVGRVTAYDLAADGTLSNRRLWADLGTRGPDGMCADAEGALWIGCYHSGEVLRVKEGGEITDGFQFDGCGISCDLGGPDGKTLYMTTWIGAVDEVGKGKRNSRIYSARVEVGRA